MLKTDIFTPTKGMKEAAVRGIELRSKGLTEYTPEYALPYLSKNDSFDRSDSLKTWFSEDWKAINSSGKVVGECGSGETKGKVKCLPASKARSLSKRDRSRLAKRKQQNDPTPGRSGTPIMVSSEIKKDAADLRRRVQAIVSIEQKYGTKIL